MSPAFSWKRWAFGLIALSLLSLVIVLAAFSTAANPLPAAVVTIAVETSTTDANNAELVLQPTVNDMVVSPVNYQIIFAAMANGLHRSIDGGKTWAELNDFKSSVVTSLVFDPEDLERPLYAGTDRAGLFKTIDNGKTWKNLGLVGRPIEALAATKRTLYIAVAGPLPSVYHSIDAGQTFAASALDNLPPNLIITALAVDTQNPQNVYIGTAYAQTGRTPDWGRIKYSSDTGLTWRDLGQWSPDAQEGPNPREAITLLLTAPGDRVYAGDGEVLWRLSTDRTSWQSVSGGLPPSGVYALTTDPQLPNLVYAATRDGFYRNSDGQSWQKLATGETKPLFEANSLPLTVIPTLAAAATDKVAYSVNGLHTTYLYALSAEARLVQFENREFGSELIADLPGQVNVLDFTPYGGINPVEPVAEGAPDPNKTYFKETGHYIQGDFKDVWELKGRGLPLYGYPLTEQFLEFDKSSKITKTVQFFERFKFESSKSGEVVAALAGYEAIAGKYFPPGRFIATNSVQQYFAETKHTLRGSFHDFWKRNGALSRFGYPISEEFSEKDDQGRDMIYQYFERAKFAFDPTTNNVSLALLGREVLLKRTWIK